MNKFLWPLIALVSGILLPIQGGLNSRLGKTIASPVHASLISFVVGLIALVVYIVITGQSISTQGLKSAPGYLWLGGILGAFYVTVVVLAFPRIGPALTFALIVAGQMIATVILEHYNILVAQQHSFNIWRMVGILLILGGVLVIRKF
jgi:transporter family-2 protein